MNQINKMKNKTFFFFVDPLIEDEFFYLKINNFFFDTKKLYPNNFFSVFYNSKLNFHFLEKNEKFMTFFIYRSKIFFKEHLKTLKVYFSIEEKKNQIKNNLQNCFFLNMFYFFCNFLRFIFLLKKFYFIKNLRNKIK